MVNAATSLWPASGFAVNLAGVDVGDLRRGDTLVDRGRFRAARRLDARVSLLPTARRLKHGARVRFHQGTTEVMARIALRRRWPGKPPTHPTGPHWPDSIRGATPTRASISIARRP